MVFAFAWAVAEATVWPLIPDFAVAPLTVLAARKRYLPLVGCIAGMAVGGSITFLFSYIAPPTALAVLHQVPWARANQFASVAALLTSHGAAAFVFQPWSGVPFKTWAVAAGTLKLSPPIVIPLFVAGRALRVTLVAAIAGVGGRLLAAHLRDWSLVLGAAYVVLFGVGFWRVIVAG